MRKGLILKIRGVANHAFVVFTAGFFVHSFKITHAKRLVDTRRAIHRVIAGIYVRPPPVPSHLR